MSSSHSDPGLWSDVRFDEARTTELVRELLAAAAAVEESLDVLAATAPDPAEWGGPHRVAFDGDHELLVRRGRSLSAALVATARDAAALLAAAEGEQRFREQLRHRVEVASRPGGAS